MIAPRAVSAVATVLPTARDRAQLAVRVLDARAAHTSTSLIEDALWQGCAGDPCTYARAMYDAAKIRRDREPGNPAEPQRFPVTATRLQGQPPDPRATSAGSVVEQRPGTFVAPSTPEVEQRHPAAKLERRGVVSSIHRTTVIDVGRVHPPARAHRFADTLLLAVSVPVGATAMTLAALVLIDAVRTVVVR